MLAAVGDESTSLQRKVEKRATPMLSYTQVFGMAGSQNVADTTEASGLFTIAFDVSTGCGPVDWRTFADPWHQMPWGRVYPHRQNEFDP